jgi:hypothetical protein
MQTRFRSAWIALAVAGAIPAAAQSTVNGKPNLTGLWQAFGTADWDIQAHGAQAGPFYQLGAIGAIPPGQGIVEGVEIPYLLKRWSGRRKIWPTAGRKTP